MSFPRYPSYKDSGVEWLGEVPEHWEVTALKRGFSVALGKMLQPESSSPDDELLPYLRAANIQWGGVDTTDIKQMWLSNRDRAQLRLESGDLLVSEGGDVGRSCLWADELLDCYFQNSVNRVRARDGHSNRYLYYWMSTIKDKGYIDVLCNKSTIAHFTAEKVAAVPVPLPNPAEQTQIAAFLDRETAKIDELVAEQRRLMELLKEKRQAVVSHAVTQGLNPDAPMKPSGIEWLGEVPAHWEVKPLVRTASDAGSLFIDGDWIESKDLSDDGIRYLTSGTVGEGVYKEQGQGFISQATFDELNCIEVIPGDVLICRLNLPIGRACIVPDLDSRIVTCVDNVIVRPNRSFDRRFFVFLLTSKAHFANMENLARGTTMQRISRSTLGHVRFAFPPFDEQTQIATFLDCETAKIDELMVQAQRAIDLLQERRTALISAAVTGQIDVRPLLPARKVGAGETATQEASKLVNLPHENHT